MTINCNDSKQIFEIISRKIYDKNITMCRKGLRYMVWNSDDMIDAEGILIVPDDYNIINEVPNATNDTRIHQCDKILVQPPNTKMLYIDVQIIKESDFIDMIKECLPYAVDALSISNVRNKYHKYFEEILFDEEKIANTYSSEARRCWEIAKEKLSSGDKTLNGGIFYLFNSIRLLNVANQMCSVGIIPGIHYYSELFGEMKEELEAGNQWDYFEKKYESIFEEAHNTILNSSQKKKKKTSRKKKNEEQKEEGSTKKRNKGSK